MSTQLQYQPEALAQQLAHAIRLADTLFGILCEDAWTMRPIALRHPCVFYYGHLPAFAWNQVFRYALGRESFNAEFDQLFERGIDPHDMDESALTAPSRQGWPTLVEIAEYKSRIEKSLFDLLRPSSVSPEPKVLQALYMVLEHYLMHVETFSYMLHQLPPEFKRHNGLDTVKYMDRALQNEIVEIPSGSVTLGAERGSLEFGWDNEFGALAAIVKAFAIDKYPVTNGAYLAFVENGGYSDSSLWSEDGWKWIQSTKRTHPQFWIDGDKGWQFRGMFGPEPLLMSAPVWVSFVEAEAFARWKGGRLPTEAEYHRAAFGTADGDERSYPWGFALPRSAYGDFGDLRFTPSPVGSHPDGASAFGVEDLMGGGWEWTCTPFAPFPGFEPHSTYKGYSADFFDDRHYVMKGASPVTPVRLVRRSFRNWFQPHYPFVYSKFRCVYEL
jgi:ergothioneine biosynthesis protein EgtB